MDRRGFVQTIIGAAAGTQVPNADTASARKGMKFHIGIWTDSINDLLVWRNLTTAYLVNDDHEGPVFKFPEGRVESGMSAFVHISYDVCREQGHEYHRPRTRIVVRVKPARQEPHDGGIFELRYPNLVSVCALTGSNTDCSCVCTNCGLPTREEKGDGCGYHYCPNILDRWEDPDGIFLGPRGTPVWLAKNTWIE